MKTKFFALLVMIAAIFTISTVEAEDINNFYSEASQNVKLADKVIGDSALAGALVDIDGKIDGIGFIAGQTINVNGVLDYGFVAGQNIKVSGNIDKNVYMAGSNIDFTESANIGRDAKIVGSTVNLSGRFGRNIDMSANKVVINDKTIIDGNITVIAEQIEILGNVTIDGTLKYNENAKIDIKDSASIKNIEKSKVEKKESNFNVKSFILSIVNLIVAILIFALLLPKAIDKTDEVYEGKRFNDYAKKFAIGLLFIICIPIVSLILLASSIGTYLGLIIIAIYIMALYIAYGLAGYIFGELIFNRALNLNINRFLIIIMGIILIKLLALIPVIGGLIVLITISIGMNTLWELVKEKDNNDDIKEVKEVKKSESAKIKERTRVNNSKSTSTKTAPKKNTSKKAPSNGTKKQTKK